MNKIFIIAGEPSGDLHGSNLVKQLLIQQPNLTLKGWGGELMEQQGVEILKHYRDLAFMGFAEVITNLGTILQNFKICKNQIKTWQPDAVIFIDYPGFNLRMAKFVHGLGIKTFYYISPQIWAWKKNRVFTIKKYINEVYSILPFEKDFYINYGVNIHYVGHPLLDAIEQYQPKENIKISHKIEQPILAILPGSRKQEIIKMLPIMLRSAQEFHEFCVVIAASPALPLSFYQSFIPQNQQVKLIVNRTYEILQQSQMAMVTSGTATLETALFNVPQVVCYKGGAISIAIARLLIKIKFISLVNLILNELVVTELIQNDLTPKRLTQELLNIVDGNLREKQLEKYAQLQQKLGKGGASEITAKLMLKTLNEANN